MSDPYAQYPGQPDPNFPPQAPTSPYAPQPQPTQPGFPAGYGAPGYPTSGQPASGYPTSGQPAPGYPTSGQPAPGYPTSGQPAPGQPAYGGQPGYFPGGQPPAKSNKGLLIGLGAGVVVLMLLLCGGVAAWVISNDDDDPSTPTGQSTAAPSAAPTGAPPTSVDNGQQSNNNAITAKYSSDLAEVCNGASILNAADYNPSSTNKAYAFSNRADRATTWSHRFLDSTASYYTRVAEFTTVSVVGCVKYVEGSEAAGPKCAIKASDGTKLTVDYMSSRFVLTFYAAKTGQKIGDGGTVNAPATKCPSYMTYNKETLKSYASPDEGTIDAAFVKLLGR